MWQIMGQTGKEYGLTINKQIDQRRDPEKATKVACDYLKKAKGKFGTWSSASASYNRGMNGLNNALTKQNVKTIYDLYLNQETSRYFYRILSLKLLFENPGRYGFDVKEEEMIKPISLKDIIIPKGKYNTVELAKKNGLTFSELKKYNPWLIDLRTYELKNADDSLILKLPK